MLPHQTFSLAVLRWCFFKRREDTAGVPRLESERENSRISVNTRTLQGTYAGPQLLSERSDHRQRSARWDQKLKNQSRQIGDGESPRNFSARALECSVENAHPRIRRSPINCSPLYLASAFKSLAPVRRTCANGKFAVHAINIRAKF